MPDKWEVDYSLSPDVADPDEDADNDGLNNYDEFLLGTYPDDNDYDGDGMMDGYEVYKFLTDPKDMDSDNDGLGDYEELLFIDTEFIANDNTGVIHTNPVIASNGYNYLLAWKSTDIEGNVCLIKHRLLDFRGIPTGEEYVTGYIGAQNSIEYEFATETGGYLDLNNPSGGNYQEQASRFVAQRDFSCLQIELKLIQKGAPEGNVFISLCSDSSGSPGTELVQSETIDASSISDEGEWVTFNFNQVQELTNGTVYWIVLKSDYTAGTDCIGWEWCNSSPNWSFNNGATWANYSSYTVAALFRVYFTFSPISENNHMRPSVYSNGLNYLVTWQTWEYSEDGGYYKIMAQIVDYEGVISGDLFQVNMATTTYQANPVASYSDDNFMVFWDFYDQDNDTTDIHLRYISSSYLELLEDEYVVNEEHENPKVTDGDSTIYFIAEEVDNDYYNNLAVTSDGSYFLELHEISNGSRKIEAQLFSGDRIPFRDAIKVTDDTIFNWNKVDVASNGFNYLSVWDSENSDGSGWGIQGHFLDPYGGLDNNVLQLNKKTLGNQKNCSISSIGLEYIVVWEDDNDSAPTSDIMCQFVKWGLGTDPNNPDTDNDGLPDYWEYINYTDLFNDDTGDDIDNDGLTNEQEYVNGTYAYIVDSDNDGLSDYEEVFIYLTDPMLTDTDNDGMLDKWELDNILNPLVYDSEYDNDGDGFDNYNEFLYRTDPHNADTDNDGLTDSQEAPTLTEAFRINTYTTGKQHYAVTTANADRNEYLVLWESNLQDGDGAGIFAQRLDVNGNYEESEFMVNSYTTDEQWYALILFEETNYFAVWVSENQDLSESGIYGRTLSDTCDSMQNVIRLNAYTLNDQTEPVIASNGDTYYVSWNSQGQDTSSYGVYGQLVSSSGSKIGTEVSINEYVQSAQEYPVIATDGTNYFVVWESNGQDGDNDGIYARIINNEGSFVTDEFMVNDYTEDDQAAPAVQSNGESYLVAWYSESQDGSGAGVYASLFDNDGNEIKTEFRLNGYTTGNQISPRISTDGKNYLVVWTSYSLTGYDGDIYARLLDNDGNFIGNEFKVNTKTTGLQQLIGFACMGLNYVVIWDSWGDTNSNYGMFAQFLDRQGSKIGSQFQVTEYPLGDFYSPSISYIDNSCLLTYTFQEDDNEGDFGVYSRILKVKSDPLNPDYDNDGLTDGDEVNIYNSNPASVDSDKDGITDNDEVNIYNTHPSLADTDNDGLSDYEEINNGSTDPLDPDSDNDGMYDGWEIDNNFDPSVNDGFSDRDNDGLLNNQEFLAGTDPNSSDSDNDGMPDKWELDNNTKATVSDSTDDPDNDGLDNFDEFGNSTNPNKADTDGDGQNDGDEIYASTDPLDAESVFKLVVFSNNAVNGEFTITWTVESDMDYFIYWSDSMPPVWDIVDYPGLDSDIIFDPLTSSSSWIDNGDDPEMNGLKPSQVDNRCYKIRVLPK